MRLLLFICIVTDNHYDKRVQNIGCTIVFSSDYIMQMEDINRVIGSVIFLIE